jgi:hypothetical protein
VADNLFNPDPYYQQGGDMVRIGGMGYRIDVHEQMGSDFRHDAPEDRRGRRGGQGIYVSPAGLRSTKEPKARRSGMWSRAIWRKILSCSSGEHLGHRRGVDIGDAAFDMQHFS